LRRSRARNGGGAQHRLLTTIVRSRFQTQRERVSLTQAPWKYARPRQLRRLSQETDNHPFTMAAIPAPRVPARKLPYTFEA
jgi:hypothetical protein